MEKSGWIGTKETRLCFVAIKRIMPVNGWCWPEESSVLLSKTYVSFCDKSITGTSKVDLRWQVVGHNNCRICVCV